MARVEIGPLVLLAPLQKGVLERGQTMSGVEVEGRSYYGLLAGPSGMQIDLHHFLPLFPNPGPAPEGYVRTTAVAGTPKDYDRLVSGVRLGVYPRADGTYYTKRLRRYRANLAKKWGNVFMTSMAELDDDLGESSERFLLGLGAFEFGTGKEILRPDEGQSNDLVLTWPAEAVPFVPFAAYTLTRILPLHRALHSEA